MAAPALALNFALTFGARTLLQLRRTGSTGCRSISERPGSAGLGAGALFVADLALLAPVLDLAGLLGPIPALRWGHRARPGLRALFAGLAGTLGAQAAMGASWRIGVDEAERTAFVTGGPFAVVRNPIFAAMIPTSLGLALLVFNAAAVAGLAAFVLALQVRLVEEPYLLGTHGDRYAGYASRVGRFFPGVWRLRHPA